MNVLSSVWTEATAAMIAVGHELAFCDTDSDVNCGMNTLLKA